MNAAEKEKDPGRVSQKPHGPRPPRRLDPPFSGAPAEEELSPDSSGDLPHDERISGKGELTRKRTIFSTVAAERSGEAAQLAVDETVCLPGRVLSVHGATSRVEAAGGIVYHCATRRILQNAQHRPAACRRRRRSRAISSVRRKRRRHRTHRAAPRRAGPLQSRPTAHPGDQCRSGADHRQRRRADAQAKPDRPLYHQRASQRPDARSSASTKSTSSTLPICSRLSASMHRWVTRCCCCRPRPASASSACVGDWPDGPA